MVTVRLQIKMLLLSLARDSCMNALASLQDRIRMLQERPADLDTFMAYQVIWMVALSIDAVPQAVLGAGISVKQRPINPFRVTILSRLLGQLLALAVGMPMDGSVLQQQWCSMSCSSIQICYVVQVVHREQVEEKRSVMQEATAVDDMYDMLAVYEQKVPTADQVSTAKAPKLCCKRINLFLCARPLCS